MAIQFCGYFPPRTWADNGMDWDALDETFAENLTPEILLSYIALIEYATAERAMAQKGSSNSIRCKPLTITAYFLYLISAIDQTIESLLTPVRYGSSSPIVYRPTRDYVRMSNQQIFQGSSETSFLFNLPYEPLCLDTALQDAGYSGEADWIVPIPPTGGPDEDYVFKSVLDIIDAPTIVAWLRQKKAVLDQMVWVATYRAPGYGPLGITNYIKHDVSSTTSWSDVVSTFADTPWTLSGLQGSLPVSWFGQAYWGYIDDEPQYTAWSMGGSKATIQFGTIPTLGGQSIYRTDEIYYWRQTDTDFVNISDMSVPSYARWNKAYSLESTNSSYIKEIPTDAGYNGYPSPEEPGGGGHLTSGSLNPGFVLQRFNVENGFRFQAT